MAETKESVSQSNPMAEAFNKLGLDRNTQRIATQQALTEQENYINRNKDK